MKLLSNKWTYYIHLHDNKDWTINSYINVITFNEVENAILLNDEINYDLIKKTMMFLMKDDIKPIWEDKHNRNGGCFSFKVSNRDVLNVWKQVFYNLIGKSITKNINFYKNINGITLSPKKKFTILKIWIDTCDLKDPNIFVPIENLDLKGCLFKKHCPEN
jgi:hypothetical protein